MRSVHIAFVLLVSGTVGLNCAKRTEGPAPELASVRPTVACREQVTTPMRIDGVGMSPMTIRALTDDPRLQLPLVSLTRVQTLEGVPVAGSSPVMIPDARDGSASHVRWTSQGQMEFDVYPDLQLEAGIYDVTVSNPTCGTAARDVDAAPCAEGDTTSTLHAALFVVPRPTITSIERAEICTAQFDQVMVVTSGSGFLVIDGQLPVVKAGEAQLTTIGVLDCVTLGQAPDAGSSSVDGGPVALDAALPVPAGTAVCSRLEFGVQRDQLPVGTYDVVITNPSPAGCSSTEAIQLTVAPPPTVTSITPSKSCSGGGTLTITGTGFLPGARVTIGTLEASNVTVKSDTEIEVTFGVGLEVGSYTVTVQNADACKADSAVKLQIVTGPIVFSSSPPVVWNGISTEVTFWASGLSGQPTEVAIQPTGTAGTPIDVQFDWSAAKPHQILATIPKATAAGVYDIYVKDPAGCEALLPAGLQITAQTSLVLQKLDPPFAYFDANTTSVAVTVTGDGSTGGGFKSVPLVYLNPTTPTATTKATALSGVSFLDASRLTGVVPSMAAGQYDVIVVNPDGSVGTLAAGLTVLTQAPPQIVEISPGSVPAGSGQSVTLLGSGFVAGTAGTTVSLSCQAPGATTAPVSVTATVNGATASATSLTATLDLTGVSAGSACVVRATNPDGSYADYSALGTTNSSENLSPFTSGTDMNVARRAPASVAGRATAAARFVYAIGGDTGSAAGALDSVEFAAVDAYGNMGAWTMNRARLPGNLTMAGAVILGRLIYVVGGNVGNGVSNKVLRAEILDPLQVPAFADLDIAKLGSSGVTPTGSGLGKGTWIYRVSAVMTATDPVNAGGETLPSEPINIQLPQFAGNLQVTISWAALPGAQSYRVYRTPAADQPLGTERLVAVVPTSVTQFVDTGDPASGDAPLPLGSTGAWMDLQRNLGDAREGAGVALVPHPTDVSKRFIFAMGGRNGSGAVLDTYEALPITAAGPASHTVGTWATDVTRKLSAPRWQLGVFVTSHANATHVSAGTVYVYAGPGMGTTTASSAVDVGSVDGATGLLTSLAAGKSYGGNGVAGYGAVTASNSLYIFGGGGGAAPAPTSQATSALICGGGVNGLGCNSGDNAPMLGNWNSQGNLNIVPGRYLMGTALESAFFFLVGGQTVTPTEAASKATSLTLW